MSTNTARDGRTFFRTRAVEPDIVRLKPYLGKTIPPGFIPQTASPAFDCAAVRRDHFAHNLSRTAPLIVWAQGNWFVDDAGRLYLDFSSQTQNLNLGNNHPAVLQAVVEYLQSGQPYHLSSHFSNYPALELTALLMQLLPAQLKRINLKLVNGTDATETALKTALKYQLQRGRRRRKILSLEWAHHGESLFTMACSSKAQRWGYIDTSGHIYLRPNDKRQLAEAVEAGQDDIAACIMEPILVNGGAGPLSESYLAAARELCSLHDIPLIFDEVQTGFGWTGRMFAFEALGVVPDMLCLAKGFSDGWPIAAVIFDEKYDVLDFGEAEYTAGMNPVASSAALAAIRELLQPDLLPGVRRRGRLLEAALLQLQERFGRLIVDVRGMGHIWGLELPDPELCRRLYQRMLERGILLRISRDGAGAVLLIKPSLVTQRREIALFLNAIEEELERL